MGGRAYGKRPRGWRPPPAISALPGDALEAGAQSPTSEVHSDSADPLSRRSSIDTVSLEGLDDPLLQPFSLPEVRLWKGWLLNLDGRCSRLTRAVASSLGPGIHQSPDALQSLKSFAVFPAQFTAQGLASVVPCSYVDAFSFQVGRLHPFVSIQTPTTMGQRPVPLMALPRPTLCLQPYLGFGGAAKMVYISPGQLAPARGESAVPPSYLHQVQ